MKRVAVLQSNYLPWKGYFDIIHDADEFIFYDEVQFTKNDWRNRNILIVNGKPQWITVPVGTNIKQRIVDVRITDHAWQRKHYMTMRMNYAHAPHFKKFISFFEDAFIGHTWEYLYQLNRYLIENIAQSFLGIRTKFSDSRDYISQGEKNEKLLSLLQSVGTDVYISGPAAKGYIRENDYSNAGIEIIWKDYDGYPVYPQKSEQFTHFVSIVDLLFNVGDDASYYIWGWRGETGLSTNK